MKYESDMSMLNIHVGLMYPMYIFRICLVFTYCVRIGIVTSMHQDTLLKLRYYRRQYEGGPLNGAKRAIHATIMLIRQPHST